MKRSIKRGFSFGVVSGIITTLGIIIGLSSVTNSKYIVIVGIFTIAIADAISDAFGMHVSAESEKKHSVKEIWQTTHATFWSKLIFSLTFLVPVLLFDLHTAIVLSIIWGLVLIGGLSYRIALHRKANPWTAVLEHWAIASAVIVITHFVGKGVALFA